MYIFSYSDKCRKNSCGFKNLDKLGVRIKKIKNTLLVGFFKNHTKSRPSNFTKQERPFCEKFSFFDFFGLFSFKGISLIKLKCIYFFNVVHFYWDFYYIFLISPQAPKFPITLVFPFGVQRQPYTNERASCPDGWVCGNNLGLLIFLKIGYNNKQDVLIPNMASKVVYGYQIKSYEQFKFENVKF